LKPASKRSSSLALRLTTWYTLSSLFFLVLATGLLYVALAANLDRNSDQFLADKEHVIDTLLRERPDDKEGLREEVELESAARRYQQFYIRLLDEHGRPMLATPRMEDHLDLAALSRSGEGTPFRIPSRDRKPFRVLVTHSALGGDGSRRWTVQIALDLTQESGLLARYRAWLWTILAVGLLTSPIAGYQIAVRGIRPVREVAETARRISSATLGARIEHEGYPQEIAALALTFNAMLDRLEDSFGRLSRFSADIAHELRTPVNNIRGEAEVALARARSVDEYRDTLGSCLEEAVRLSDLIGSLLFLARSESPGAQIHKETADLGELLHGVQAYYEASAAESGVSIEVEVPAPVNTAIDRALLQRAVGNLVSNALAHTPAGGRIVLGARDAGGSVIIGVEDTGEGIPSDALPKVFDRFYRVDPARSPGSGRSGLGLAIVQGIMVLHGGSVHIESKPGEGTKVSLRMTKM
jgi:two-component system heavy metal sensor histidine kinase CusS